VIAWGIQLFVETPIVKNKQYNIAEKRAIELINIVMINKKHKMLLARIIEYLEGIKQISQIPMRQLPGPIQPPTKKAPSRKA
jgi:hypothetical protein